MGWLSGPRTQPGSAPSKASKVASSTNASDVEISEGIASRNSTNAVTLSKVTHKKPSVSATSSGRIDDGGGFELRTNGREVFQGTIDRRAPRISGIGCWQSF